MIPSQGVEVAVEDQMLVTADSCGQPLAMDEWGFRPQLESEWRSPDAGCIPQHATVCFMVCFVFRTSSSKLLSEGLQGYSGCCL